MKKILKLLIFQIQKILLNLSYYITKPFCYGKKDISWVVGTEEISAYLYNISTMLGNTISVSFNVNEFYDYKYTYSLGGNGLYYSLSKLIVSPILLGYLAATINAFFYIGATGFLLNSVDGRNYEFSFLKKRKKLIVCSFLGNDIRSPKKMLEFASISNCDVTASYYHLTAPERLSLKYENLKKMLAYSADMYADIIYNAPVDQLSYLNTEVRPFFYIYSDEAFFKNDLKYINFNELRIFHAPSSPIVKGTQIVRAVVKKLEMEGYKFKYTEMQNELNQKVIEELKQSHIVLNEFYAFVPGVFGVEAMANHCALLTSADCTIESCLPPDSNEAWFVTKYWQIYDHLKLLLDNPSLIREYADKGFNWVRRYASYSAVKKMLNDDLSECFTK